MIESIQNRSLITTMPVFATTPIHAMQVQAYLKGQEREREIYIFPW